MPGPYVAAADLIAALQEAAGADLTSLRTALNGVLSQKVVILLMGQSNMSGRGTNNQAYTGGAEKALLFGNDYVLKTMVDPSDSSTAQVDTVSSDGAGGSVWPLVASRLASRSPGLSFVFVPAAKGATSITQWLPATDHQDRTTLYGSAVYRAKQAGSGQNGVTTVVLWWQGETDAAAGMSQATYNGHLQSVANAVKADLGVNLIPCKFQTCTATAPAAGQAAVWAAIAAGGTNITVGPDLTPIVTDSADGYHLNANMPLSRAADKWVPSIQAALGLPVGLDASTNLIRYSEKFDLWTPLNMVVTPDAIANPLDGAITADLVTSSATTGVQKSMDTPLMTAVAGNKDTDSYYVKSGTAQFIQLFGSTTDYGTAYANFDIINGVLGTLSGCEAAIESVGGGWYRIQANFTKLASRSTAVGGIGLVSTATAIRRAVNTSAAETFYLFGAMGETRGSAGPYAARE